MSSKKSESPIKAGKSDEIEKNSKSGDHVKYGENEINTKHSHAKQDKTRTTATNPSSSQLPHFSLPLSVKRHGEGSREAKSEVSSSGQSSTTKKCDDAVQEKRPED